MAREEGDQKYCHITGEVGTLCGTVGSGLAAWAEDDPIVEKQQKRGLRKCNSCGRLRCQECIRVWESSRRVARLKERMLPKK